MKFIVWIKESKESAWEENGEGKLTAKQAERIARETRIECGVPAKYLPVGVDPNDASQSVKTKLWFAAQV